MDSQTAHLTVYVRAELRELVIRRAREGGVTMQDVIAGILAKAFERPDLADVPRRKVGRKFGSKNRKGRSNV